MTKIYEKCWNQSTFNNQKNQNNEYKYRCQDKARMIQTRMWKICPVTKRLILDLWKLKIKFKKWKRIHFIVQHSRHSKDNESSETKIHPPERNKKGKIRIQTCKTFCKKNVHIFEIALMKNFQKKTVFQKPYAKKWLNFFWNENQSPSCCTKD